MNTITFPITIEIPTTFWRDHGGERGCSPTAEIIKQNDRLTTVILDAEAWDDLYSDADYYATQDYKVWSSDYRGTIASARATLKRMKAVGA